MRFDTRAIHVHQTPEGPHRPVIEPIYQTSTFAWEDLEHRPDFDYSRLGNPNRRTLEAVVASLEGAAFATAFGSGMAAIAGALSFLKPGDALLLARQIYGGTAVYTRRVLENLNVQIVEFDAQDPDSIARVCPDNAKWAMFESPTNPNLRVINIEAVVGACRAQGLRTVFDNTFATPYLQSPLALGVDIVVHSTTKYMGGHSDLIGGVAVTNDELLGAHLQDWVNVAGAIPGPFDCWLALRGLKTLAVRMREHCRNAQAVAEFLSAHPKVHAVHYPGLASHPDHALAARQMRGFGGMLAFEVDDPERVVSRLRIFQLAPSLGGVESLVGYPRMMSHVGMTEEARLARGIPRTMLRMSVGLESVEDLIADLDQALA